jgi:hypothetical protein
MAVGNAEIGRLLGLVVGGNAGIGLRSINISKATTTLGRDLGPSY